MSVSWFIALRHLKASRSNRFFSWIATLTISGIAIGVAALIVVISIFSGFERELRNRFLFANAHLLLYRYPSGMQAWDKWSERIKADFPQDVKALSPFVHHETMAKKASLMHAVQIRGISPDLREKVQSAITVTKPSTALNELQNELDRIKAGEPLPSEPKVILGVGLASLLEAKIGDSVSLISPVGGKFGRVYKFKVIGYYDSGFKHYDNKLAVMSLAAAQNFFQMGDLVTGLEVGLYNPDKSRELEPLISQKYNLSVKEWQSFNRTTFEAIKYEKAVIGFIISLVALIAGCNILTTLFVSVSQRRRDIAILRSLGASNNQIQRLFLFQGVLIGCLGSLFGTTLALVFSFLLKKFHFVELPDLYMLTTLPIEFEWNVYTQVIVFAIVISILAGIYPAWSAMNQSPTEGLRGLGRA